MLGKNARRLRFGLFQQRYYRRIDLCCGRVRVIPWLCNGLAKERVILGLPQIDRAQLFSHAPARHH